MQFLKQFWTVGFLVLIGLFLWGRYFSNNYTQYDGSIDFFVSNESWWQQSSWKVSYSSWDRLKYTFLYKYDAWKSLFFDEDKLQNRLNLSGINIQTGHNDNGNKGLVYLEIDWKAKDNWQTDITKDELSEYLKKTSNKANDDLSKENANNTQKDKNIQENESTEDSNMLEDIDLSDVWLSTYSLYDTQSQLVELKGYEYVDKVNIWESSITPEGKYLSIDAREIGQWVHDIVYYLSDGSTFEDDKKFQIVSMWDRSVGIYSFNPDVLYSTGSRWISVQGYGFENILAIQLSSSEVIGQTDFELVSDRLMGIKIPEDIGFGKYHLNIMVDDGIYRLKEKSFEILPEK